MYTHCVDKIQTGYRSIATSSMLDLERHLQSGLRGNSFKIRKFTSLRGVQCMVARVFYTDPTKKKRYSRLLFKKKKEKKKKGNGVKGQTHLSVYLAELV